MWSLYMGQQPYEHKDGIFMRNPFFPHFPQSAPPEYTSLAESCLRRDPRERPSFVEITSRLNKFFYDADSVPGHLPPGTPPQHSPPMLNVDEASPAGASATAPAHAIAAAAAPDQATAPDTATSAASDTATPATATTSVTNVDGCSSDEMQLMTGTSSYAFSHFDSRHALASSWGIHSVSSQQLRSQVQDRSDGHHQPTQPALSPPGTNARLIDSGVPAHMAHACDEQRLQPGPGRVVLQEADSQDVVYSNVWIQT